MTGFGKKIINKKKIRPKQNWQADGLNIHEKAVKHHAKGDLINAEKMYRAAIEIGYRHTSVLMNLGVICKDSGREKEAILLYKMAIRENPNNPDAYYNLSNLYQSLGNFEDAITLSSRSVELKPNNPQALVILGWSNKELGNLDQALAFTLQSLELKPENFNAHMNLGGIYKSLGKFDLALASILKSLELKPNDPGALHNLKGLVGQLSLSQSNYRNLIKAYEIVLNQTKVSHRRLSRTFLQIFLPTIKQASSSDQIIEESNEAFKALATDWRFHKSITLLIPLSKEFERFMTRTRKELLGLAIKKGSIPQHLKPLTDAVAAQCFLNEYVYTSSQEENVSIRKLINAAADSQEATNRYLSIIGCYKAIHTTEISPGFIDNYPTTDESAKELIASQFKEPRQEQKIKNSIQGKRNISDTTSQKVQKMYEDNPYPRFKFSDYIESDQAKPIYKFIEIEATRKNMTYKEELRSSKASPKVLIAGCGTGNQIIAASRYKNAQITAIDLSSTSLAYAIRKSNEYEMNNVTFRQMDLLNVAELSDMFDIIECGGVLHHTKKPSDGLSALLQQLKPGGYIKLGLYSEIARKIIVETRKIIESIGSNSSPESIRKFRKHVLDGEIQRLSDLPNFANDFYSLSECRDLCFHVQEHHFTTEKIKDLLEAHNLTFCGFMVPEQIKRLYQKQYTEDTEMTSLHNWGKFEVEHPSTFKSMYQFWVHKPI